jgi:hypothetical protein
MEKAKRYHQLILEIENMLSGDTPTVNVFNYTECLRLLGEKVYPQKEKGKENGSRKKRIHP